MCLFFVLFSAVQFVCFVLLFSCAVIWVLLLINCVTDTNYIGPEKSSGCLSLVFGPAVYVSSVGCEVSAPDSQILIASSENIKRSKYINSLVRYVLFNSLYSDVCGSLDADTSDTCPHVPLGLPQQHIQSLWTNNLKD